MGALGRVMLLVAAVMVAVAPWRGADAPGSSAGCSAGTIGAGDYDRTLSYGGRQRDYHLHVPPGYRRGIAAPMVLSFHGGGGNAAGQERLTAMASKSDAAGFILVEPDGIPNPLLRRVRTWNAGNCCGRAKRVNSDDVSFIHALIDTLEGELCIDRRRTYATGLSNGAMMSYRLACELSDRIAAIAPIGGGMGDRDLDRDPPAEVFKCAPTRPVPILHIHGLADQCYHFAGGKSGSGLSNTTFVSIPATIDGWVARNHCSKTTAVTYARGAARCRKYQDCAGGGDVVLCTIEGAGHNWPGRPYPAWLKRTCGGEATEDLSANDLIWNFFKAHPMP